MKLALKKSSPEWQEIIAENKNWFSKSTLEFFHSTVFWSSLTETSKGKAFITSEQNYTQDTLLYTVRIIDANGKVDTLSAYGEYESLHKALDAIKAL